MEPRTKGNIISGLSEYQTGPGARLRSERERRQWSVDRVAKQINLTTQAIKDLEENHYHRFSAIVFIRGYLRAYARLLELPAEEILADFDQLDLTEQVVKNSPDIVYEPHRELTDRMVPWAALIGGVLVLFIGLIWWHLQRENREILNQVGVKKTSAIVLTNVHNDGNHEIVLQGEPDPLQPIKNNADKPANNSSAEAAETAEDNQLNVSGKDKPSAIVPQVSAHEANQDKIKAEQHKLSSTTKWSANQNAIESANSGKKVVQQDSADAKHDSQAGNKSNQADASASSSDNQSDTSTDDSDEDST